VGVTIALLSFGEGMIWSLCEQGERIGNGVCDRIKARDLALVLECLNIL